MQIMQSNRSIYVQVSHCIIKYHNSPPFQNLTKINFEEFWTSHAKGNNKNTTKYSVLLHWSKCLIFKQKQNHLKRIINDELLNSMGNTKILRNLKNTFHIFFFFKLALEVMSILSTSQI